jgi:hypothetical protein
MRTLGPPPPVGLGSEFRGCRRKAPRFAILVCVTCQLFLAIFSATPRIGQSSPKKLVRARDRGRAD